jgi:maleylpyruvate isomerase
MKLYSYWRSSASWRVRIALHYKGLAFEYQAVHLIKEGGQQNTPAYEAINSARTVPVLEFTENGKLRRLSQSLAIIELLEERHPTPALLPKDSFVRAQVRELAELVNSGIQPLQNSYVIQHVKKELHQDEQAWGRFFIARGLKALETKARETAGRYLVGDEPTLADVCLVPQLYGARRYGIEARDYPTLARVEQALAEHPAFVAAHANNQPDTEK